MSKQIKPNELAEIVAGLLIKPELLNSLMTPQEHRSFMLEIGLVVANHCGGAINGISEPDVALEHGIEEAPLLSVSSDNHLPENGLNAWALHDPEGWEETSDKPIDSKGTSLNRQSLQCLLNDNNNDEAVERFTCVVISTGHFTKEDNDALADRTFDKYPMVIGRPFGFYLKIDRLESIRGTHTTYSDSLNQVIEWAAGQGYNLIEFDADASVMPGFPVFDW